MRYNSVNRLSDFEFHDAWFSLDSFENNCLTVKALCLNIHKDVEQNPHETDMEIENAVITFEGFDLLSYEPGRAWRQDENGKFYTDEPQIVLKDNLAHSRFSDQLAFGLTVFALGIKEGNTHFIDAISKDPFFTVSFTFKNVIIEWDEYIGKAWYTKKTTPAGE